MEKRGVFIVLDGIDGSGKGTQTQLLVNRLRQEGHRVESADFPQYGSWSAAFVERYLRGEFGTAQEVDAKKASLFYALDRYAASFQIRKWLEEGDIVISNRYTSANKGHQLGKIQDPETMHSFLKWLNELEYDVLGIPVPNLTLFLHMDPIIGQQLVDKKGLRAYIQGEKRDIHEKDVEHLQNAERAYLFCIEHDPQEKWKRILCFNNQQPKTMEEVHQEIYKHVQEMISE